MEICVHLCADVSECVYSQTSSTRYSHRSGSHIFNNTEKHVISMIKLILLSLAVVTDLLGADITKTPEQDFLYLLIHVFLFFF